MGSPLKNMAYWRAKNASPVKQLKEETHEVPLTQEERQASIDTIKSQRFAIGRHVDRAYRYQQTDQFGVGKLSLIHI